MRVAYTGAVAPQSTSALVLTSSKVSVVQRCTGMRIEFGPSSREQMTSLEESHLSHLGWRNGEGFSLGTGCVSSSLTELSMESGTSCIERTEK